MLEGGALLEEKFAEWSKQAVLYCDITARTPASREEQAASLLSRTGGRGFPHIVFLDETGTLIETHMGARTVEGFDASLKSAAEFVALKRKADKGDASAKLEYLIARGERDQVALDEVEKAAVAAGTLAAPIQARMASLRIHSELASILKGIHQTPESQKDAAAKAFAMREAKRIPAGQKDALVFWQLILFHAQQGGDADTFEAGIAEIRKLVGNDPGAKGAFDRMEAQLKRMREAKEKPPEKE